GRTNLDLRVAAVGPAQLLQPAQKCRDACPPFGIVRGRGHQHADPPRPFRLLRARRERPRGRCAAEQRDELAAPQLIELHAVPSQGRLQNIELAVVSQEVSEGYATTSTTRCSKATANRKRISAAGPVIASFFPEDPLATQEGWQIRDRLDSGVNLEAQLFRNFGGASLYPESSQPRRDRGDPVPVVRRDKTELRIAYPKPLSSKPINAIACLENLHLLDTDDLIEQIADSCALSCCLQHLRLAVRQDRELQTLLLERLKSWLYVWEGRETQIGVHQLLFFVGRQLELQVFTRPNKTIFRETPEVAVAPHEAAHQAVLKLL